MHISCPKCDTKFAITVEQIGHSGKKVKCSKCFHIWHQTIDNHVKVGPILTPQAPTASFGNGVNLPAILPLRPPLYLYTMPVVLLGMIIFILVMLFSSSLGQNSIFGNNRINIQDVQIDSQKDSEKIIVRYKIQNSSDKKIQIPLVRIRLFDKNNRILQSRVVDHSKVDLAPWQDILIKTEFIPAPEATESVDIMIGNKLDFILR